MSRAALDAVIARIEPVDRAAGGAAQAAFDRKTKPRGSLGELESLACRVAAIRGTAWPGRLRAAVVLAAGDHGYAAREVSAYPQEVTRQMVANFPARPGRSLLSWTPASRLPWSTRQSVNSGSGPVRRTPRRARR